MLTGMSNHDLEWYVPSDHIEHREHCTMIGSNSRGYADTCFLCRSFQSSDTAAPNPNSTAVSSNTTESNMLST